MAVVYQHRRNDTNDVFYVGVGVERKRAFEKSNRNKHWKNITNKIDYSVDVLFDGVSYEDACNVEKGLIESYGRKDLGTGELVNMKEGGLNGSGWIMSEETKRKIGKANSNRTVVITEETKIKISNSLKGTKKPIGFNIGRIHSEETLRKMRQHCKSVVQKDLNGNVIKIWNSVREIKEKLKINTYDALEKTNLTAGGYIWDWNNQ